MQIEELLKLQTQRGAKVSGNGDASKTSFDNVKKECRRAIEDQSSRYRNMDAVRKRDEIKNIIIDYIMTHKPMVEGFINGENQPDINKLMDKLIEDITDYGILAAAMADDSVFEIRCNGKELKVEVAGHVHDLTDADGNIVSFESPEQQEIIMRKLLGDVRLTPKDAIVNARTLEGFRMAAVHSSVMAADPANPTADAYHAFVLRKFKKEKMKLGDIVLKGTMSDGMARFLSLLPGGGLTFFTVGPTASGKTTTNNAILQAVPSTTRTVVIENPSELDLRMKDATGRVYNDLLQMEGTDIENASPHDATPSNLMDHTLRLSPTFICFGELRTNKEFKLGMKILQAGHSFNASFHSESSAGAVNRFLTAYLAESGNEPSYLALRNITDLVHVIIVQKILRDGTRRVIQISEVVGVDPDDREKPLLNDLYIYDIQGDPEYDDAGNVVAIHGEHKRVGKLSPRTIRKFQLEGVAQSRFDYLLEDPSEIDVETYTGKNIETYGMY